MNADFVLTNLGNLPFERQYGQLRLEALWQQFYLGRPRISTLLALPRSVEVFASCTAAMRQFLHPWKPWKAC
jgi:hypothetical protein